MSRLRSHRIARVSLAFTDFGPRLYICIYIIHIYKNRKEKYPATQSNKSRRRFERNVARNHPRSRAVQVAELSADLWGRDGVPLSRHGVRRSHEPLRGTFIPSFLPVLLSFAYKPGVPRCAMVTAATRGSDRVSQTVETLPVLLYARESIRRDSSELTCQIRKKREVRRFSKHQSCLTKRNVTLAAIESRGSIIRLILFVSCIFCHVSWHRDVFAIKRY